MSISWSLPDDASPKLGCKFGKHDFSTSSSILEEKGKKFKVYQCVNCDETKKEFIEETIDWDNQTIPKGLLAQAPLKSSGILTGSPGNISVDSLGRITGVAVPSSQSLTVNGLDVEKELLQHKTIIKHLENEIKLLTILIENLCQQKKLSDSSSISKSGSLMTESILEQKLTNS